MKNKIVISVLESFKKRSEIGIKKYNTTLERSDLSTLEWLQHAQEEAMDFVLYLERLKQEYKSRMNDEVYLNSIDAIKAAANELNYEDKYKVSAVEQFNCINLKIQMPYEYDKVHKFKEYMTAKELAEII
jgi:hypothetical protein